MAAKQPRFQAGIISGSRHHGNVCFQSRRQREEEPGFTLVVIYLLILPLCDVQTHHSVPVHLVLLPTQAWTVISVLSVGPAVLMAAAVTGYRLQLDLFGQDG